MAERKHAIPKFHSKSVEAARANLKRLNTDPAFRHASSLRLKQRYAEPEFRTKQATAASQAARIRHAKRRSKAEIHDT